MPLHTRPPGAAKREAVNRWVRTANAIDGFADFDKTILDPNGDNLHPNDAQKAMDEAVSRAVFQ